MSEVLIERHFGLAIDFFKSRAEHIIFLIFFR
jgi:hypothetical protein